MQLILAAVAPCFILICASRSTCCTCTFSSSPAPLAPFHLATSWHPPASCATTIVRPSSALEGFPFGCGIVVVTLSSTLFCALPCPAFSTGAISPCLHPLRPSPSSRSSPSLISLRFANICIRGTSRPFFFKLFFYFCLCLCASFILLLLLCICFWGARPSECKCEIS